MPYEEFQQLKNIEDEYPGITQEQIAVYMALDIRLSAKRAEVRDKVEKAEKGKDKEKIEEAYAEFDELDTKINGFLQTLRDTYDNLTSNQHYEKCFLFHFLLGDHSRMPCTRFDYSGEFSIQAFLNSKDFDLIEEPEV